MTCRGATCQQGRFCTRSDCGEQVEDGQPLAMFGAPIDFMVALAAVAVLALVVGFL